MDSSAITGKDLPELLCRADIERRLGLKPRSLSRIKMPPEDGRVGRFKGWTVETVEAWLETRPGRGRWGARGPLT